jgi:microcystin-dependent protein
MSDLPGLLDVIGNNTASEVRLTPESLAVLLYALDKVSNHKAWLDYHDEPMSDADIELIHELVDLAADDIMRPLMSSPVGATMMWHMATPPPRWLVCDGQSVLKADWPELYAVWGNKYGSTSTHFTLIDMRDRSPLGIGTWFSNVDSVGGAFDVTLGVNEIPDHSHTILLRGSGTAGGANNRANAPTQTTVASNLVTDGAGGGQPHANLHPVIGVQYIVYGGLA